MLYYVIEGEPNGKYNASSKARNDVNKILENNKFRKLFVNSKNGVQKNIFLKWKQFFVYESNKNKWYKSLNKLKKNDIVLIQYPILNTTYSFNKIIDYYNKRGIIFVALVHDLDSLRFNQSTHSKLFCKRVLKEDTTFLSSFNYIIAHNDSMKKELVKMGNIENKIITLELFDYLLDSKLKTIKRKKNDSIIIAGNLSSEKANFLKYLKYLNIRFNLFGVGITDDVLSKNISYKGKFSPEELVNHLEGSFGLVWDGNSIDKCSGGYGDYLRFNNPHKASLYLTAGIPIIVWKSSALASFVLKNNIGIVVNNLKELDETIKNLSNDDYLKMQNNARKISQKTVNGKFLSNALSKVMSKVEEDRSKSIR